MPSTMAQVFYNWTKGYRQLKGAPLDKNDYMAQWGDLGGAMYDWGKQMYATGAFSGQIGTPGTNITEDIWGGQVDTLSTKYPVGGVMAPYYPPKPAPQSEFGAMGAALFDMVSQHVKNFGGITKQALINSWGDLGGAIHDYLRGIGSLDGRDGVTNLPDKASFIQNADYLAKTYEPGGGQGFIYKLAPTPQGQIDAANLAYLNQQIENAKKQGLISDATAAQLQASIANMPTAAQAQAQINQQLANLQAQGAVSAANAALINAQIANLPTQAQAQAQIQGQIDLLNQQIEALRKQGLIDQATADKINAEIANMPTPEMAKAKFNAEITNLVNAGQLTQAQAGLVTAQTAQIGAEIQANPRDWVKAWYYQRGLPLPEGAVAASGTPAFLGPPIETGGPEMPRPGGLPGRGGPPIPSGGPVVGQGPPTPPWLSDILQNKAAPAFSGQSGTLGSFPIPAPSPNQVSAKVYNAMAPSEVSGLEGLASSSGWFWPDYIKKMYASQQRQPGIGANPVPTWGGF